jgi:K+-transporting ATPase KdpF subunit
MQPARRLLIYGRRVDRHYPAFLCNMLGLRRLPGQGGQDMENLIVGLVAVALIIYLFVVLLRPHKF